MEGGQVGGGKELDDEPALQKPQRPMFQKDKEKERSSAGKESDAAPSKKEACIM